MKCRYLAVFHLCKLSSANVTKVYSSVSSLFLETGIHISSPTYVKKNDSIHDLVYFSVLADDCLLEVVRDPVSQFKSKTSHIPAIEISDVIALSLGMSTEVSYFSLLG